MDEKRNTEMMEEKNTSATNTEDDTSSTEEKSEKQLDDTDEEKEAEKKKKAEKRKERNKKIKKTVSDTAKKKVRLPIGVIFILIVLVIIVTLFISKRHSWVKPQKVTISVESRLQKVVTTSDLYTGKFIYNGVVPVNDQNGKLKYYVKYEGTAKAGLDVNDIKLSVDEKNKKITVQLPRVRMKDFDVAAGDKLGFLYMDGNNNKEGNIKEALQKANQDLVSKAQDNDSFISSATENAKHAEEALVAPLAKREGYTVNVLGYGETEADENE